MENERLEVPPFPSVVVASKEKVPGAVAVPEKVPDVESVVPVGGVPDEMVHETASPSGSVASHPSRVLMKA